MSSQNLQSDINAFLDGLPDDPSHAQCSQCGASLVYLDATFFTKGPQGRTWSVPLPVCLKCDLGEDIVKFVPFAEC